MRGKAGVTLLEVAVGSVIVGVLMMSLGKIVVSGRGESGRLIKRSQALSMMGNFVNYLGDPEVFKALALEHPDSNELRQCFEEGCDIGASGVFQLLSEDSRWQALKPIYRWEQVGPTLVKVTISFDTEDPLLSAKRISLYHSRKNFLSTGFAKRESRCEEGFDGVPNIVAGINTKSGEFICRSVVGSEIVWESSADKETIWHKQR